MISLCVSGPQLWRSLWCIPIFLSFILAALAVTADYVYLQLLEPRVADSLYNLSTAKIGSELNSTFFYTKLVPTVPPSACSPIENSFEVSNNIAFSIRGGCSFVTKAVYAQAAGAVAFIAYDYVNTSSWTLSMIQDETSRQITIPCAFMRGRLALEILTRLEAFGLKYAIVNFPVNSVGASIAVVHHRPWTLW
uniref:Protease-associated domain-containing protein 1 n=1 Tax=Schistocephalus solidus TaxID=70667 RepID=A0A0X3QHM9_SCHSO